MLPRAVGAWLAFDGVSLEPPNLAVVKRPFAVCHPAFRKEWSYYDANKIHMLDFAGNIVGNATTGEVFPDYQDTVIEDEPGEASTAQAIGTRCFVQDHPGARISVPMPRAGAPPAGTWDPEGHASQEGNGNGARWRQRQNKRQAKRDREGPWNGTSGTPLVPEGGTSTPDHVRTGMGASASSVKAAMDNHKKKSDYLLQEINDKQKQINANWEPVSMEEFMRIMKKKKK